MFTQMDSDALLDALRTCRSACIQAGTRAPIGEPVYKSTECLLKAIDDLAGILTGDREYLQLKVAPSTVRERRDGQRRIAFDPVDGDE
jgi:hypothetical protein